MIVSVRVIGAGRVGSAIAARLRERGIDDPGGEADVVLLCVPDGAIAEAAGALALRGAPRFLGHVSGATPLSVLEPARLAGAELFGLHPLQTFSGASAPSLAGAGCAIAGSTPAALDFARCLAEALGCAAFELDDERRASYHAAASIASNFLVTLEAAAETVAAGAGFAPSDARALLAPLVRETVDNWAARGPEAALTGPVARGDKPTVAAQRAAVADSEPALIALFDALVERTEALAARKASTGPLEVAA